MDNKKIGNDKILFLGIVFFVILSILLFIVFGVDKTIKKVEEEVRYDEIIGEYIYKIRYDFGAETYIYLLKDKDIRTVTIQPVYEVCPGTNCVDFTGEYDYLYEDIDFSEIVTERIINIFDYLYEEAGSANFNADELELTKYDERVLLAIVLNSEDNITIEDNLLYDTISDTYKDDDTSLMLRKTVLFDSTDNEIVNSVAKYLNDKVTNDFDKYVEHSKIYLSNPGKYNLDFRIEFAYAGPYSFSFKYIVEGILPEGEVYDVVGYTFNYNGDIREFDMGGWKQYYYENAIKEFKKDKLFKDSSLVSNWKEVLYNNMFLVGNWYLDDEKVVFLIEPELFGFDDVNINTIEIFVDLNEEF